MSTIPTQTCWHCKHFSFMRGGQHYSELTPGYNAEMECDKQQWRDPMDSHGTPFAEAMEIGFTCKLFKRDTR
jgi:hypothetical protein